MPCTLHQPDRIAPGFHRCLLAMLLSVLLIGFAGGCNETKPDRDNKEYVFWPPFPDEPRVQYLTTFTHARDITHKQSELDKVLYGKEGEVDYVIDKPYGVATANGRIYVCDTRAVNLTVLDIRKKEIRLVGTSGAGRLMKPIAVAIAPDGTIYVADTQRGGIYVYDNSEHFVGILAHEGLHPVSLAVNARELFVVNMKGGVEVWNRATGQLTRTISKLGRGKGELAVPIGIAVDPEGNLYVNDMIDCRVQKFGPDGSFVSSFGAQGDRPGSFARPKHMACDSAGYLYVVDAAFQNVQVFDKSGQMLTFFGGPGDFAGAMELPAGVCVCDTDLDLFQKYVHPAFQLERLVIVTNQFGDHKVAVYGLGHLKPGRTAQDISGRRTDVSGNLVANPANHVAPAAATQSIPPDLAPKTGPDHPPLTQPATFGPATQPGKTNTKE